MGIWKFAQIDRNAACSPLHPSFHSIMSAVTQYKWGNSSNGGRVSIFTETVEELKWNPYSRDGKRFSLALTLSHLLFPLGSIRVRMFMKSG